METVKEELKELYEEVKKTRDYGLAIEILDRIRLINRKDQETIAE